jgi:hypothetical protein
MATVTASTKRVGAVVDGLAPDATENIASLQCFPLDPVDPEVTQGIEGLSFRELLQTFVEKGLDIVEGDLLVVGSVEYPIKAVADWYWGPDSSDYLALLLEDQK